MILKLPQSMQEYFDFKELDEHDRDLEHFTRMVRDEGIRIARKLIATGLDPLLPVLRLMWHRHSCLCATRKASQ